MNYRSSWAYVAGFALVGLLAACKENAAAAPIQASAPAVAQTAAAPACPTRDLKQFVTAFAESEILQHAFTATEVQTVYVDGNAQPEPAEVVRAVKRDQLTFPVMPNRARQRAEGLQYREVSQRGDQAIIALEVPDTDSQLLYTFKRNGCWSLVRIVDPGFAPAAAGQPVAALESIAADVMRSQYGDTFDTVRNCWATTFEDQGETLDYCMRPGKPQSVSTPRGARLFFIAYSISDFGRTPRRYSYDSLAPGLAGAFAVALDAKGGWTLQAASKAEPFGTAGECGCSNATLHRLGHDLYGWMFSSGGVWQGVTVSNTEIWAPSDGVFKLIGTIPDIREDKQDVSNTVTVDASNESLPHYPLTVTTTHSGKNIGRRTIVFDARTMRYDMPGTL